MGLLELIFVVVVYSSLPIPLGFNSGVMRGDIIIAQFSYVTLDLNLHALDKEKLVSILLCLMKMIFHQHLNNLCLLIFFLWFITVEILGLYLCFPVCNLAKPHLNNGVEVILTEC